MPSSSLGAWHDTAFRSSLTAQAGARALPTDDRSEYPLGMGNAPEFVVVGAAAMAVHGVPRSGGAKIWSISNCRVSPSRKDKRDDVALTPQSSLLMPRGMIVDTNGRKERCEN